MHELLIRRVMQRYWRWTRALTLGARAMVIDAEGRILLVRHTYMPGWIFPGGGVEFGETLEVALQRELAEEANVSMNAAPELFGIYSNENIFPGDHVALYLVRQWSQSRMPEPNREIAEVGLFAPHSLPQATTAGTRRRLAELLDGSPRSPTW